MNNVLLHPTTLATETVVSFHAEPGATLHLSYGSQSSPWALTWQRNGEASPPVHFDGGRMATQCSMDGGDYVLTLTPLSPGTLDACMVLVESD